MQILIHAPSDFNNLCVMIRTLECFGILDCRVFDPHRLIRDRYGKSYGRKLRAISAGAFARMHFAKIEDTEAYIRAYSGRALATVPGNSASSLYDWRFADSDLLVFGSEASGLPDEIIRACHATLTIPQAGLTQSLNLCVAAGIFLSEWARQRGEKKNFVSTGEGILETCTPLGPAQSPQASGMLCVGPRGLVPRGSGDKGPQIPALYTASRFPF